MTLKYKIKFYDYWHLSSGLSAGAKLDSTVVKDKNDLPYAPGKTIKGLLREVLENQNYDINFLHYYYFSNAVLDKTNQNEILSNNLQSHLYDIIASTKIDKNGVAKDNTLREIEVVVPLELYGEILDISLDDEYKKIAEHLKNIKRMGLNRNRGLGRCEFLVEEQK